MIELCKTMGRGLEIAKDQQQTLEISAWIHDIGLIGVPRHLIKQWEESPATLTDDQRILVQHHPVLGADLARFRINLQGGCAHHSRPP